MRDGERLAPKCSFVLTMSFRGQRQLFDLAVIAAHSCSKHSGKRAMIHEGDIDLYCDPSSSYTPRKNLGHLIIARVDISTHE